jgi:hypothetical protein
MRKPDPSSFFRLNEEVARELARLDREGALDRLKALLDSSPATLRVSAVRAGEGLEELIGELRPGVAPSGPRAEPGLSPRSSPRLAGCGGSCGTTDPDGVANVRAELGSPPGGFDWEGFMAVRSQFVVELDGEPREVYMPDHICPSCWNLEGNAIRDCARTCGRCGFAW